MFRLYLSLLVFFVACKPGKELGSVCESLSDCASDYQCLSGVCAEACTDDFDCGQGYVCQSDEGLCLSVLSNIGDTCYRERDCGQEQRCEIDISASTQNETIIAHCQAASFGRHVNDSCSFDTECRSGQCSIGRCTEMCQAPSDCPGGTTCTNLPIQLENNETALYRACVQDTGVITHEFQSSNDGSDFLLAVPGNVRSIAIVTEIPSDKQYVEVDRLISPTGRVLHDVSIESPSQSEQLLRTQRSKSISTTVIPYRNNEILENGFYRVHAGSFTHDGQPGTHTPKVTLHYKMDRSADLNLEFVFVDLEEHPCESKWNGLTLNAQNASSLTLFQERYIGELRRIFNSAEINIKDVTYRNESNVLFASLNSQNAKDLFKRSTNSNAISVFFVRSMTPSGTQALNGGRPGPPRISGTPASGIAISAESLCYRDWDNVARTTAHNLAQHMGLFMNRSPSGLLDPISDSGAERNNLMYFGEFGETDISRGQARVLKHYPGLH